MTGRGGLRVTVTARQRLALGVGSEVSYFTGTHPFAPGSVLRGALAAAWIAEHGPPAAASGAAAFGDLFDGPIRYGPMFVPGTVVVPVSARRCKYPRDARCASLAVDEAFETGGCCPACDGPLEPGKGQVILPGDLTLERITRTSIEPSTAKAADGELYAHGALPAGTVLTGYIHGRDPWLERPRRLRLGGRRTVGGSADYQAVPLRSAEEDQMPNEWPGLDPPAGSGRPAGDLPASPGRDDTRLVIRLASPAVFVDAAGRPSLEPDPVLDLDGATVERRWARPVTWSGWHAASRLPKPDEVLRDRRVHLPDHRPGLAAPRAGRAAAPGGGGAAPRRRVRRHPDRPGALAAARPGRAQPGPGRRGRRGHRVAGGPARPGPGPAAAPLGG